MSKTFRPWKIDEPLLLPPVVQEFVAKAHLARLVLNLVREDIDLAAISGSYAAERGQPPFDPVMMSALLLYSYCSGIYSSHRIAKARRERVDFMSIVGFDHASARAARAAESFDHLVGAQENRRGCRKAKRLGGPAGWLNAIPRALMLASPKFYSAFVKALGHARGLHRRAASAQCESQKNQSEKTERDAKEDGDDGVCHIARLEHRGRRMLRIIVDGHVSAGRIFLRQLLGRRIGGAGTSG
jgi:hypothetical protein